MGEALAWKRGDQVVPNLHWVVSTLNQQHPPVGGSAVTGQVTAPSSSQASSLCPLLLCQSQQEALSTASPSLRTAVFLKWPLNPTFVIGSHTDWAGNPRDPTSHRHQPCCPPLIPAVMDELLVFSFFSSRQLPHSPLPTAPSTPPGWSSFPL